MEKEGVMPGRVVGKTSAFGGERGLEIDAWLRSVPYDVESFVILDDREDMAMHRSRLVQVNPEIGLTLPLATRAIELLAKPCHRKV
jgi:hypothetical protein